MIEEVKGLRGDGAAGALADGAVDVGEVKDLEHLQPLVAEGGGVEAATRILEDVVVFQILRGSAVRIDRVGLHVGAHEGGVERAADGEHGVTKGVGIKATTVGPPEQFVLGIGVLRRLPVGVVGGEAGELVGAGEDETADEVFEVPPVSDEVMGEVIEQQRMCGRVATGAEVIDAAHEALAEEVHPHAVDEDSGGERIVVASDPLGELQATALIVRDLRGLFQCHRLNIPTRHLLAEVADVAANVDGAVGGCVVVEDAHRLGTLRAFCFGGFDFLLQATLIGDGGGQFGAVDSSPRSLFVGEFFFAEEPDGVEGHDALGVLVGDEDEPGAVFFEAEFSQRDKARIDGWSHTLIDEDLFLTVGMENLDGHLFSAARCGGVGDPNFIGAALSDLGNEGGCAGTLGGVVIVNVTDADVTREVRGIDPRSDALGL